MIKGHGVDLVVDRLADGLAKIGYNCEIYCNYFDETFTGRKAYKIKKFPYTRPLDNPIVYERMIRRFVPYLNDKKIDLFIIQSFPFYSLIPKLKKPTLVVDHGIISLSRLPLKRRLWFKYMEFSQNLSYFNKAGKVITVSQYLLDCLPRNIRKKAGFIYNGSNHYQKIDFSKEEIEDFKRQLCIEPEDILLLFVGRLNFSNQPYKGLEELTKIYHHLYQENNHIKFLAVGYGSRNDEELLRNQGILSIKNASEDIMPLIYKSCDIYTTCSRWEGFDLPVVEAQNFGKPVVCYDIGAHPEVLINNKTGFIVKDTSEFLEKLKILINEPETRKEFGKKAKEFSKKFTWEKSVEEYDKEIRKLLNIKETDLKSARDTDKDKTKIGEKVAVVIVNYNSSYTCMKECIDSLKNQTYKNIEITIFDNNSQNDTLDSIKKQFKDLKIIYSDKNLGLGEAINRTLEEIAAKYVLISNFDVVYNFKAVEELVSQIGELDESYIGLAPKIKFYYQQEYIESVGTYIDNSLYIGYTGKGQLDMQQYNRPENVFGVSFTSCFIKREAFDDLIVGKVDPTFFLFYEDIDFCYRANILGYKFQSCPTAVCYHKYAYSFRDDASFFQNKYYYQKLNLLKTAYKNTEESNLKRIMDIELNIQKQNLKDKSLKSTARNILKDFNGSLGYLKKCRPNIQFSRLLPDSEIIKYCWGEFNFYDEVKNEPVYSVLNLHRIYQRLFVLIGNEKYEEYTNYLINLENTRIRIESENLRKLLHSKLKYEPKFIHEFIDKIS
ncbi:MAG: hypothetical protein A2163_02795 [Actinobacteria bacterium RBG_13_35_12]|nr:MAG: hypothetical protein A2163_02795 [Actinobacteria bacterium RBG_13_35_12]